MTTLREKANAYEPVETKNIVELEKVSTEIDITEKKFQDKEGKEFTINVVEVEGEEYRVPTSVIKQLKAMIAEKPDMVSFKVTKTGEGLKTTYTVIPLD